MENRKSEQPSTRDRILVAAATMFSEDPGARLSVRAVAARAGVSTGSLRYHFPTQRALLDTMLATLYGHVAPDHRIHDRSVPARDRLVECLRQVVALAGVGQRSRELWGEVYRKFIEPEPTEELRAATAAVQVQGLRRIESWLAVLTEEGALAAGDNSRRARFLQTVVDGLTLERAMPTSGSPLQHETDVLYTAVDCVLRPPA
ncbi:TetR/AcrR family transcriptional regulator [Isoptericola cucumis]|uniref:HTH tetR-type domain-containing protein n=1 Tax=Isoptericola cucumis TaxID=1776856 RepID=A0ABQ2B6Q9_9MICO|nr:TetR/AcrR family transcriptional regulator [Isoptericola cucumis]GGI09018.1 hypothetical protein GCM10007368_24070 [Isoptericola cucumis]